MRKIPRISKEERLAQIQSDQEEAENIHERSDSVLADCMNAINAWNGNELISVTLFPSSATDQDDSEYGNPLDYAWVKEELEYVKIELEKLGWSIKETLWPGNDGPESVTIIIE